MVTEKQIETLAWAALEARDHAYVPYSNFAVGAALLTKSGKLYEGANIENAAYTPTNCAERTAFFRAVFEGERAFAAIAVAGGKAGEAPMSFCAPCGVCRQVMREFCGEDFVILLVKSPAEIKKYTLAELLPESFGPDDLN